MTETIAQILGFGGALFNAFSFQQKTRKGILAFQICSTGTFILHYILLNAFTGAALNVIAILRAIVFINSDKKWAKSPIWLGVFIFLSVGSSLVTWETWYSILPAIGMTLSSISYWMKNETKIRVITLVSSPFWLVYNFISGSMGGTLTEFIVMSSIIIGIIRYDILKKSKKVQEEEVV